MPQVRSDIIVIKEQLWPATHWNGGIVGAVNVHRTWFYIWISDFRNCRHIKASKENLRLLPTETVGDSSFTEETVELIVRSRANAVIRRYVSHLSISSPMWAQLPSDIVINKDFEKLPADAIFPFSVDGTARCSCGNTDYNVKNSSITTNRYIVFGSTTAMEFQMQTVYCTICANTHGKLGPDLGNYGILNWNNKMGFTHQLLNRYTSCFTRSETSFNAYYYTIKNEYLNN